MVAAVRKAGRVISVNSLMASAGVRMVVNVMMKESVNVRMDSLESGARTRNVRLSARTRDRVTLGVNVAVSSLT